MTPKILNSLASTYVKQGRYVEAENITLGLVGVSKTVLGEKHADTTNYIGSLAYIYNA
jgi:hypothetical protein